MTYIPAAAWGMFPGGTDAQIANYFGSWGLLEDAPAPPAAIAVRSRKSKFWSLYNFFYKRRR